jgi:phospholipid-translocating ATPase
MFTYVAPLAFVLVITMFKEAYDDCKRRNQDKNLNNKEYDIIVRTPEGTCKFEACKSQDLKVGHIVKVGKN